VHSANIEREISSENKRDSEDSSNSVIIPNRVQVPPSVLRTSNTNNGNGVPPSVLRTSNTNSGNSLLKVNSLHSPETSLKINNTNSFDGSHSDDSKSQIADLQEENKRLKEENVYLQEDMNSFDEKLACLEITLGIIDSVEKSSSQFSNLDDSDEENIQEEDRVDKERFDDDNSRCSSRSRGSVVSRLSTGLRSMGSRKSRSADGERADVDGEHRGRRSRSRKSTGSAHRSTGSQKSQQSTRSRGSSASSRKSTGSHHSTGLDSVNSRLRNGKVSAGLASIGEEDRSNENAEGRDEQPEITEARAGQSSPITATSVSSMSSKARKELKILRGNNTQMLYAIKALSRATTLQTRKHYHYKRKFGHSRKNLVEGNQKMTQLLIEKNEVRSSFLQTRAQFLEEQDKREELSYSVKTLARTMNDLRKKLKAEEETKMTVLERIDEGSVSVASVSLASASQASVSLASTSEPVSSDNNNISIDSLDEILSPTSQKEGLNVSPMFKLSEVDHERETEASSTRLTMELEIIKLKAKLQRREDKIRRLEFKFDMVKGYLNGKKEAEEREGSEVPIKDEEVLIY